MTLAQSMRNREKKSVRDIPPHLTYMIAETMIPPGELDVTRFRGYGIGQRDPATLPGRKNGSESEHENRAGSQKWDNLRRWVQSANSAGVKANV